MVYQAMHVTVGHQYSTVALLPEVEAELSPSWLVPSTTQRVTTTDDKEVVGAAQVAALLTDRDLPFHQDLCVEVGDSRYSKPEYLGSPLGPSRHQYNLVKVARVRSTRTLYQRPSSDDKEATSPGVGGNDDSGPPNRQRIGHSPRYIPLPQGRRAQSG